MNALPEVDMVAFTGKAFRRLFLMPTLLPVLLLPLLLAGGNALASAQEGDADFGDYLAPLTERAQALRALWHGFLRTEASGDPAQLARLLATRRPPYFDTACESPPQPGDDERLRQAVASVLMTGLSASVPGTASALAPSPAETGGRGRYLACLQRSGAGNLAARLEIAVQQSWLSPMQTGRALRCVWQPQGDMPAYANHTTGQITWHSSSMQLAQRVAGDPGQRYAMTYANLWFHEALHLAGPRGHSLISPVVACCGDAVQDRAAGCAALDDAVARDMRLMHLSGPLGRSSVLGPAQALFSTIDLTRLTLALYDQLGEQLGSLAEPSQRAACIAREGQRNCSQRVLALTRSAVEQTLGPRCTAFVSGDGEPACRRVDAAMRSRIAAAATSQLMQAP